jgi:hypothetical protein
MNFVCEVRNGSDAQICRMLEVHFFLKVVGHLRVYTTQHIWMDNG